MVFNDETGSQAFKISINWCYVTKLLEEALQKKFEKPEGWTKKTAEEIFYDYVVHIEKEYNYYVNEDNENHQCFVDWFYTDDNYSKFVRFQYVRELFRKS